MSYTVILSRTALKALEGLPVPVNTRIKQVIEELKDDPRPAGCKKLRSKIDLWRVRVGDYRVIYSIDDPVLVIEILRVGHRGDIYR